MRLSRRDLLKLLGVASACSLALTPSVAGASIDAAISATQIRIDRASASSPASEPRKSQVAAPSVTPMPSTLVLGHPTDVAWGWDGTLRAIGSGGSPHEFDSLEQTWRLHGNGVDAATYGDVDGSSILFFRGAEVLVTAPRSSTEGRPRMAPLLPVATATPHPTASAIPSQPATPTPSPRATPTSSLEPTATPSPRMTSTPSTPVAPTADASVTPTAALAADFAPGLTTIAALFPDAPPSMQLGVDGAANVAGEVLLFKSGLYWRASAPTAVQKLTAIGGWPTSSNWTDGLATVVGSGRGDSHVAFVTGQEVLIVDFAQHQVSLPPIPLSEGYGSDLTQRLASGGIQALLYAGSVNSAAVPVAAFQDSSVVLYPGTRQPPPPSGPTYLAAEYSTPTVTWPSTWHPVLMQAPVGRSGALWGVSEQGEVLQETPTGWGDTQFPGGHAVTVAVGSDGVVYAGSADEFRLWKPSGGWDVASPPLPDGAKLVQLAVGAADFVWVRDDRQRVFRYHNADGSFSQANLGTPAAHVAANPDGTVWHCTGGDTQPYRLLSEGSTASQPVPLGQSAGPVTRVASTGFGRAVVLTGTDARQLFSYESPYLFKTSTSYDAIAWGNLEMGLGNVYLTIQVTAPGGGPRAFTAYVVALDAQTGAERWRTAASSSTGVACTDPVFDQLNQLLYVGTTAGALVALEPTSGAVRWTYALDAGVHAAPALSGSQLCVGTDSGAVYLFDTANAAAAQAVNPVWRAQGPAEAAGTRVTTPLLADGLIYVITWVSDSGGIRVAPSTIEAGSGQLSTLASFSVTGASLDADFVPLPPVVGTHLFVGPNTPESAIFFNGYSDIQAVSLEGPAFDTFTIPDASLFFSSGIAQDPRDGSLYVGDSGGTLHVLDANLKPKRSVEAHDAIISTPVIDIDSGGQAAVYFGAFGPSSKLVWVLDPDSGNLVSIDTNQTSISLLSKRVANGVLYAAGNRPDPGASLAQVFALRVDTAVAAERAFIIESQLMQDYDEPTAGSLTSTARYQTHLTVVDDLKAPLGYEGLRIWAEAPTQVTIGGRSFSIDTRTPAVVQTEADGSLEIVSDATDMFATPLRVWATFMDPFERIVAYPDAEFHQRLAATVHDPTSDDPTTINLATARDYTNAPHNASGGTSLFSASEQPRAAQVATAIKTMSTAAGLDGPTVGRAPAVKGSAARADKYVAYPGDLPGTDYFPTDRSALRSISTPTPTAFSLNPDGSANEFSSLAVTDAAIAIDQLEGRDGMSALLQVGGISDWFKHLWDDIKKGFAKVTQFIVSVARDIYVGIQYVVNGITYAVKQIIRGIDDVAAAIGSFFVKLGKLIKNVIEAISIIFHFDRILDTQRVIEDFFSSNLGSLGSDINAAVPAVTTFLGRDESAMESDINAVINKIKGSLDAATLDRPAGAVASQSSGSGTAIAGLGQMGSTPHTIFSVAPVGDQRTQSHAVPCTWAMRKVSGNLKSVSSPATASLSDSNDPVSDFFATFLGTLQSDQTLNTAFAQTRADFEHTFRSMSVRNFLSMAVVDLLDVIKDLLIGAVAVVKALLAGLLEALGRGLSLLTDLGNLEIPIISSLYKALTGSPLTFIDLATFVAAIPITLLYRILDGKWPSQDSGVGAASGSPVMRRVAGLSTAIAYMFAGIVTAVLDAADIAASNQPLTARGPRMLGWKIAGAILLLGGIGATIFQGVEHTDFTGTDWVIWGTNLAALVVVLIVGGVGAVLPLTDAPLIGSMLNLILTVFQTYVVAGQFVSQEEKGDKPDVALFVAQLLLAVPMLVNPVKFFPAESLVPVVAPVSDVVFRLGAAGAYVADTVLEWSKL